MLAHPSITRFRASDSTSRHVHEIVLGKMLHGLLHRTRPRPYPLREIVEVDTLPSVDGAEDCGLHLCELGVRHG